MLPHGQQRQSGNRAGSVPVITEGPMDAIAFDQTEAARLATLGTALTHSKSRRLDQLSATGGGAKVALGLTLATTEYHDAIRPASHRV